jgi:hypothetical protein
MVMCPCIRIQGMVGNKHLQFGREQVQLNFASTLNSGQYIERRAGGRQLQQ